jgi:ABC-type multidrug transport system fused ATPase/permease subunit
LRAPAHHLAGGLLQGLNEDSLAVQQAISDKAGLFLQHITTFVVGYIVAFWRGWDMTLVMVGCLPFLAAAGAVMARVATSLGNKQAEAYTEVGHGVCECVCVGGGAYREVGLGQLQPSSSNKNTTAACMHIQHQPCLL